mgnify:CR=1 FL=1
MACGGGNSSQGRTDYTLNLYAKGSHPMIDLYTAPTPNGHKASCTLEALEIPYETHFVNISDGDQHKPDFRALNPNGRIPVIVDRDMDNLAIFESGAIMILSLIHISEPTRLGMLSRMPSSA